MRSNGQRDLRDQTNGCDAYWHGVTDKATGRRVRCAHTLIEKDCPTGRKLRQVFEDSNESARMLRRILQ